MIEPQTLKTYDVQIGGYSLKLKTDQKSEKVNQLVKVVEGKIKESLEGHSNLSIQKALILSCLNMAEDYVNLKSKTRQELDVIESKLITIKSLLKSFKDE